jgi:Domain of unknown function (DUF4224)
MNLLDLPAQDQLQITPDELERLTGSPQAGLQIDWLKANGWAYTLTRAGKPVVGRLYANLKLSGVEVATIVQPSAWQPDFGALHS